MRRPLFYFTLWFFALLGIAAPGADAADRGGERWVLAINEGTSGAQDGPEAFVKYEEFVGYLGRMMGRRVVVQFVRDADALHGGMKARRFDLAMARAADTAARGVRDFGYTLVATTKGDGYVMAIVKRDAPIETIKDVQAKRIALAAVGSYTGRMSIALLRDNGIDVAKLSQVKRHRDEAVIGYAVDQGMADVGFVASYSSVGRQWQKRGGRVLAKGPLQPFNPIVASPSVNAADLGRLRAALLLLDRTDDGKVILERIGLVGFEERSVEDLDRLLKWIGQ